MSNTSEDAAVRGRDPLILGANRTYRLGPGRRGVGLRVVEQQLFAGHPGGEFADESLPVGRDEHIGG